MFGEHCPSKINQVIAGHRGVLVSSMRAAWAWPLASLILIALTFALLASPGSLLVLVWAWEKIAVFLPQAHWRCPLGGPGEPGTRRGFI